MSRKIFLKYPCGKLFELKFPISIIGKNGKQVSILPGAENYFIHAKKKFEINNLKVIEEEEVIVNTLTHPGFISLTKRIRSIE